MLVNHHRQVTRFSDDIENNLKKYGILVYGITIIETLMMLC